MPMFQRNLGGQVLKSSPDFRGFRIFFLFPNLASQFDS